MEFSGVTVNAIYDLITYTVEFVVDGTVVAKENYDYNNQTVTLPEIPAKANHRAVWERYEVVPGGMTINVRYISPETDAENAEEKFHYGNMVDDFSKHGFTGDQRTVVENVQKVGQDILWILNMV